MGIFGAAVRALACSLLGQLVRPEKGPAELVKDVQDKARVVRLAKVGAMMMDDVVLRTSRSQHMLQRKGPDKKNTPKMVTSQS